jgi:predicted ATPase
MRFDVLPVRGRPAPGARSHGFLVTDNWDDYHFKTMYHLLFVGPDGEWHDIGEVKIGKFGMDERSRTELPDGFESLGEEYFSLGQDDSYYERLNELGSEVRDTVLPALRDVALDISLFDRALGEKVMGVSLLRSVTPVSVRGQFARLARGGARLTSFDFSYQAPAFERGHVGPSLDFAVKPDSKPPTNIHVLIGRNGVGKTHLLQMMSRALVVHDSEPEEVGAFSVSDPESMSGMSTTFANLVSVSFSAFDEFEPLPVRQNKASGVQYSYIGLKTVDSSRRQDVPPWSRSGLATEFVNSVRICRQGARTGRWLRALRMLEADPIFADVQDEIAELARRTEPSAEDDNLSSRASGVFRRLSSGHKIVLLTVTRLVETVEERSLVLLDEPEAHLHPPLLSAFIRALSDLLINRNGVAIIATHSPVVLQEVPKSCVWKVRRTGQVVVAERPETETFGENVGVLTRDVFGLEVTQSGFHRLISDAVAEQHRYDDVVGYFDGQLGGEALAIARALVAERASNRGH